MATSVNQLLQLPASELERIPADTPPPGLAPQFDNPPSIGPTLVIVLSIFAGCALISSLVRIYAKTFIARAFSWDDVPFTLALMGTIAYYGTFVAQASYGVLGIHQWDLHVSDLIYGNWAVGSWLAVWLVAPILGALKLAVLLFLYKVFWPLYWIRLAVWITGSLSTAFYTAVTIVQLYFSSPRPGQSFIAHALSSENEKAKILSVPSGAVGLAIDLTLLTIPIVAVFQLQLQKKKRIRLLITFSVGILACISSAFGLYYRVIENRTTDITYYVAYVEFWATMEFLSGILITCAPLLSRTLKHHENLIESAWSAGKQKVRSAVSVLLGSRSESDHSPESQSINDGQAYSSLELVENAHWSKVQKGTPQKHQIDGSAVVI